MSRAAAPAPAALLRLVALPLALAACVARGRPPAPAADAVCRPVDAASLALAPWDSLVGTWHITVVATRGPLAGRVVEGTVTLQAEDAALRRVNRPGPNRVSVPVVGATDLAVEEVGAVRMGDLRSTDLRRPGV